MKVEIVGIENVDYESKKTGKRVEGFRLHVQFEKENCQGYATDVVFIAKDVLENFTVGDEVELLYNKYGRVASLRI